MGIITWLAPQASHPSDPRGSLATLSTNNKMDIGVNNGPFTDLHGSETFPVVK